MTVNKRAECPLCHRVTGTFVHNGRRIFQHHYAEGRTNAAVVCDASGWIVEDDELRVVARRTRSDAGIAQPSRNLPSPVPQENNGRST